MRRNCRTMSYSFTLRPTIRVSLCTTCRDARPHTPLAPAPHPRPARLRLLSQDAGSHWGATTLVWRTVNRQAPRLL